MSKKPNIERVGEKLTAAEKDRLRDELVDARLEHTTLLEQKHAFDKKKNEELNVLDDKIQRYAESIRDDVKYEDIEVRLEPIDANYEMARFRADNGRKLGTRPMTEDEREEADKRKAHLHKNPPLPFDKGVDKKRDSQGLREAREYAKAQAASREGGVKVGPRDATPAPDELEHNGQKLTKVKRGGRGKGRKRGEARA
jgi:hypothetical protein